MNRHTQRLLKPLVNIAVVAVLTGLVGCSGSTAWLDRREEKDPAVQRAMKLQRAGDIDGAIEMYRKALERKGNLAVAHLGIALLYDVEKHEYIRAIYHYERYLELRPNAEKRKRIEDAIRVARLSFAASLPETPSGAVKEIAELKRENEMLRNRLLGDDDDKRSGKRGGSGRGKKSKAKDIAPPAPKPEPAQPAVQTYRVQRGDTLSSIAAKMYNDPNRWMKIYDANRAVLSSPESLRVGQVLKIPR